MTLLHAVTRDIPDIPDANLVAMIKAISPYVDYVQLREKSRSAKSLGRLISLILMADIPAEKLIVNDRADIAHALHIPRTHLTEKSLSLEVLRDAFPDMKFGRSFHSIHAIERALSDYDYGYLGHIFRTSEKSYPALGIEPLEAAYEVRLKQAKISSVSNVNDAKDARDANNGKDSKKDDGGKLIAIGGIDVNSLPLIKPFIDGAAVMSALFPIVNHQFDIERGAERARALRALLDAKN